MFPIVVIQLVPASLDKHNAAAMSKVAAFFVIHFFCYSIMALDNIPLSAMAGIYQDNRSGLASLLSQSRIPAMPVSTVGQSVGPTLCSGRISPYLVAVLVWPHRRKPYRRGKSVFTAKDARDITAHSGAR